MNAEKGDVQIIDLFVMVAVKLCCQIRNFIKETRTFKNTSASFPWPVYHACTSNGSTVFLEILSSSLFGGGGKVQKVSNQKVAKHWLDSRCGSVSLCP